MFVVSRGMMLTDDNQSRRYEISRFFKEIWIKMWNISPLGNAGFFLHFHVSLKLTQAMKGLNAPYTERVKRTLYSSCVQTIRSLWLWDLWVLLPPFLRLMVCYKLGVNFVCTAYNMIPYWEVGLFHKTLHFRNSGNSARALVGTSSYFKTPRNRARDL